MMMLGISTFGKYRMGLRHLLVMTPLVSKVLALTLSYYKGTTLLRTTMAGVNLKLILSPKP